MESVLKTLAMIAMALFLFWLIPGLFILVLLALLIWLLRFLLAFDVKWFLAHRDAALLRLAKLRWVRRVPWVSSFLGRLEEKEAERARQEEETRRKQAEAEARDAAERELVKKERDAFVARPIPPDVKRDMQAFLNGEFVGEDRSPLAYVGYRVGKTYGLSKWDRHRRLDVCFRTEVPNELSSKYQGWGQPGTLDRLSSMTTHLNMLADMRRYRRNYEVAVAEWEQDAEWLEAEFSNLARKFSRHRLRS